MVLPPYLRNVRIQRGLTKTMNNGEGTTQREDSLMIGDLVRCKDNPAKIGIITQKAIRQSNILMKNAVVFYKVRWFDWDVKHDEHWWMIGMLDTIVKNQKNV